MLRPDTRRPEKQGAPDVGSMLLEREAGQWDSGGARLVSDNNRLAFSVLAYPIPFLSSRGRYRTRPHVEDKTPVAKGVLVTAKTKSLNRTFV